MVTAACVISLPSSCSNLVLLFSYLHFLQRPRAFSVLSETQSHAVCCFLLLECFVDEWFHFISGKMFSSGLDTQPTDMFRKGPYPHSTVKSCYVTVLVYTSQHVVPIGIIHEHSISFFSCLSFFCYFSTLVLIAHVTFIYINIYI